MPFGYLLATLSTKEKAMLAAEDDPDRKLPELVYTMFVPVSKRISRVNDARLVRFLVKVHCRRFARMRKRQPLEPVSLGCARPWRRSAGARDPWNSSCPRLDTNE